MGLLAVLALAAVSYGALRAGTAEGTRPAHAPTPPALVTLPMAAIPKGPVTYHPITANVDITNNMLLNAGHTGRNWLTYGGSYRSERYSSLAQLKPGNVHGLSPVCAVQTGKVQGFEATPIVVNGVMYISSSAGPTVMAVNAATCQRYWTYSYPEISGLPLCCGADNRGVAVADNRVYFATLDDHLIALNARTGRLDWARLLANPGDGYSETEAPLAYGGQVIMGVAGGEYGVSGWIRSYDGATGAQQWSFDAINFASGTWGPGNYRHLEGGAATWMTGTLDPATKTLYWGVGNPSPDFLGSARPGANLYSESTVALDVQTGKLKWYYQYTPHDLWDYDSVTPAMLIGGNRLVHCDKNGFCYVLSASTGKLILKAGGFAKQVNEFHPLSTKPAYICPGPAGATEWDPTSYSPKTGDIYVAGVNMCGLFTAQVEQRVAGEAYWGSAFVPDVGHASGSFTAINAQTGKIAWKLRDGEPMVGSALTTTTGLVFTGNLEGDFEALNAATGAKLWTFQTGAGIHAPAVTYEVGGRQYVAVASGDGGWNAGFGATGSQTNAVSGGVEGDTLYVFATPG